MTGPYPPQPGQPWQNPDGSWQQQPPPGQPGQPPQDGSGGGSYDLYPQDGGWPDQSAPTTGGPGMQQPYGAPPPPAYGPTSAPPYGAPPPGQFMPPGPPPSSSGGNKGWIIGGIAVAAVVLLIVIGVVVVANLGGDGNNDNTADPGTNTETTPEEQEAAAKYKFVQDLCESFDVSATEPTAKHDGADPSTSSSDYGDSGAYMYCSYGLEGGEYDLGTLYVTVQLSADEAGAVDLFDSAVDTHESSSGTTMEDVTDVGQQAKVGVDDSIGTEVIFVVQDANAVFDVSFFYTDETADTQDMGESVGTVVGELMANLAA